MNRERWQDQVVDGSFRLLRYLGGSESSAVFLTEYGEGASQRAAIKLVPADVVDAGRLLARWEAARRLSHPHLIRLFQAGRCRVEDREVLYLVMEYAEEDLARVLAERPLSPAEALEVLGSAIDALEHLHAKGFSHARLKPSNILAAGDQLKLSSDGVRPHGEASGGLESASAYDAPELPAGGAAPSGDVWSLAITLVEALTQRPPVREAPALPDSLPQPFLTIARHALQRDPARRWTLSDIRACLRGEPVGKRGGSPSALRFARLALAGVLLVGATFVATRLLNRPPAAEAPAPAPVEPPPVPVERPSPYGAPVASPDPGREIRPVERLETAIPSTSRAPVRRVLPEVPQSASETIQGTVRVTVRVTVNPAGNVTDAAAESPGSSRYFTGLALDAARKWVFDPALEEAAPEDWLLRFQFQRDAITAEARREGR